MNRHSILVLPGQIRLRARWRFLCSVLALLALAPCAAVAQAALTLDQAVLRAQALDPWLEGSVQRERSLLSRSTAAGTLPDPVISAGLANLPVDTFDFDQEAMTQVKVGVTQALPRGDSRELRQRQLSVLGEQHPFLRADRRAKVGAEVAALWLDVWRFRRSIELIEMDRQLFEQLVDVAQSRYTTAHGATRQQDVIRAQLELTRLDDRLVGLNDGLDKSVSMLSEWLDAGPGEAPPALALEEALPGIALRRRELVLGDTEPSRQVLAETFATHPAVLAVDKRVEASSTGIRLAEQQYKPEWKLNASYGYRDDDPLGRDRADFFSVGVSFDLPLFTARRQDQQLQSAEATTESLRTERALLLRKLIADFYRERARLLRLGERQALYETRLLQEMSEQAEASLSAYTNDDGDFAEVVRAKIAEFNARLDKLEIDVERQKTVARLNYFFAAGTEGEY